MHDSPQRERHPGRQRKRRDFLPPLTKINLVVLLLLCLLETFVAERHWLTLILLYLPQHWIGVAGAVLTIWAICRKQPKLVLWNGLGLAFFVFYFLGFNVPLRVGSAAPGTRLRVMTYNIHYGSRGVPRIIKIVRDVRPDVICMQETRAYKNWRDPVPELQRLLPGWHMARGSEVTTFSRYPIVSHRSHLIRKQTGRVILETQIALPRRRLSVFNVHLSTASRPTRLTSRRRTGRFGLPIALYDTAARWQSRQLAIRHEQTGILLDVASRAASPQVVVGDFNNPPRGLVYRRLTRRFQDAFRAAGWGWGYTFRTDLPVMRIDYIFLGSDVHAVRSFVPRVNASDHRPVVADIAVP